jgi:G:T-mismatch repair DNA endonuclease (very short patch repair protein)
MLGKCTKHERSTIKSRVTNRDTAREILVPQVLHINSLGWRSLTVWQCETRNLPDL